MSFWSFQLRKWHFFSSKKALHADIEHNKWLKALTPVLASILQGSILGPFFLDIHQLPLIYIKGISSSTIVFACDTSILSDINDIIVSADQMK